MSHSHGAQKPGHDHTIDYSDMYQKPWVKDLIGKLQRYLKDNAKWLDLREGMRVLDYACGHGTVSLALLATEPGIECRGLDADLTQVARYNNEAQNCFASSIGSGKERKHMHAIAGDLVHPTAELDEPEWHGFDLVVISMALHHVPSPVDTLKALRGRLRDGGSILIIDLLNPAEDATSGPGSTAKTYNPQDMIQVASGDRVWPGFTESEAEAHIREAGFTSVDFRTLPAAFVVPGSEAGSWLMAQTRVFFAKAVKAEF